jgi:hypothetical protein
VALPTTAEEAVKLMEEHPELPPASLFAALLKHLSEEEQIKAYNLRFRPEKVEK